MDSQIHYTCKSCNYKFKRSVRSAVALNCPYCGSPNVVEYKPVLASDLLNSVADM